MKLYPYQEEAVNSLVSKIRKFGAAYNGSEIGVGKSVMSCCVIKELEPIKDVLIVCPAVMRLTWEREIRSWLGIESCINTRVSELSKKVKIRIMSYEFFTRYLSDIPEVDLVIFDEAQYLKSIKAKRTKAAVMYSRGIKYKMFLSGTPFINTAADIFPALNICDPKEYCNFHAFANKYSNRQTTKWGIKYKGYKNAPELTKILKDTFFIRYTKKDVGNQLPPLVRVPIYIKGSMPVVSKELVTKALEAFNNGNFNADSGISRLRKDVGLAKVEDTISYVEELLEQGRKVLLFCHHIEVGNLLYEGLEKYIPLFIRGETSAEHRQMAVDAFQDDDVNILVMNIVAGGVGITLNKATDVVFAEYSWTYADNTQAEGRAHRNGQLNEVTAHYLIVADSIDEIIYKAVSNKMRMHNGLLEVAA